MNWDWISFIIGLTVGVNMAMFILGLCAAADEKRR
jgi:hypothetical protein